jgi:hypothetical protein
MTQQRSIPAEPSPPFELGTKNAGVFTDLTVGDSPHGRIGAPRKEAESLAVCWNHFTPLDLAYAPCEVAR